MTEVSKIRVGLVDDQALVRTGFAMVIDSQDDMKVVLEASNGKIALERLTVVPADVILMDIRMPVMDGLEATATITSKPLPTGVSPKILILTTFEEEEYIMGAVQAGASGFLVKDAPPDQMLEAIRTIHRGDAVIGPSSTKKLVEKLAKEATAMRATDPHILDGLTEREIEVLKLVAQGLTNGEIAEKLYLSPNTVRNTVSAMLRKRGLASREQLKALPEEK